jgi:hypothetical protein
MTTATAAVVRGCSCCLETVDTFISINLFRPLVGARLLTIFFASERERQLIRVVCHVKYWAERMLIDDFKVFVEPSESRLTFAS